MTKCVITLTAKTNYVKKRRRIVKWRFKAKLRKIHFTRPSCAKVLLIANTEKIVFMPIVKRN